MTGILVTRQSLSRKPLLEKGLGGLHKKRALQAGGGARVRACCLCSRICLQAKCPPGFLLAFFQISFGLCCSVTASSRRLSFCSFTADGTNSNGGMDRSVLACVHQYSPDLNATAAASTWEDGSWHIARHAPLQGWFPGPEVLHLSASTGRTSATVGLSKSGQEMLLDCIERARVSLVEPPLKRPRVGAAIVRTPRPTARWRDQFGRGWWSTRLTNGWFAQSANRFFRSPSTPASSHRAVCCFGPST